MFKPNEKPMAAENTNQTYTNISSKKIIGFAVLFGVSQAPNPIMHFVIDRSKSIAKCFGVGPHDDANHSQTTLSCDSAIQTFATAEKTLKNQDQILCKALAHF